MQQSKTMTRRFCLLAPFVLAACRRAAVAPALFPESAAGGWRRTAVRELPVAQAPDPVPRNTVKRIQEASYDGPGKIEARAYELTSSAVGLDLVQRWRPSADTVFFYRDEYFVVVKWEQADRKSLTEFVRDVQKRLGKPDQKD